MKRVLALVISAFIMLSFVACNKNIQKDENANSLRIVTSFYPVYVATMNVVDGVDGVEVTTLVDDDHGCLHGYMITSEDMEKLSGARLFIASGKEMEMFVGGVYLGIPRLELLDCGEDIQHTIEDGARANSHYWMNIENAIDQCEKIKRTMCRTDPMNAEKYESNAEQYKAELKTLIEEVSARTEKLSKKKIGVYHDSFEYFAEEFGIRTVTVTDSEVADGSYKDILKDVEYLLVQKDLADSKDVRRIAKEIGCEVKEINTLATGKITDTSKDDYIKCVRENLSVLEEILG